MKTTLISHASLLIQSGDTTLLTDPVFFNLLWEECNVPCPSIDLDLENLPTIDVLYISHRHQDNFDIRTLAHIAASNSILATDAIVLAPRDEIVDRCATKSWLAIRRERFLHHTSFFPVSPQWSDHTAQSLEQGDLRLLRAHIVTACRAGWPA